MAAIGAAEWLHLGPDETVVWASRPHPIELGPMTPVAIGIAILALGVTAWGLIDSRLLVTVLGGLALLGAGGFAAVRYLCWTTTCYVITSEELYTKHGVITRDVTQFRLDRVQNTSLRQSVAGRVLGYGELTVYTAGSGDPELTFERVPRPERAASVLSDQLDVTEVNGPTP